MSVPQAENQQGEENQEDKVRILEENYYYPENHEEIKFPDSQITKKTLQFQQLFGFDSYKRYNLHLLNDETIIFISGISFQVYNFVTKESQIYFSKDKGGIGSISVHPSKKYFAVCEKGSFPNVYIFEFPSLKLYRVLRKGTERSYSNSVFSTKGDQFATVGSYPDYQLCIWDWKQEKILLKSKAFSQEIYRVNFSQYSEDQLSTSGMGHLKFWKIAETFTGLKLKGEIAKFGQVELSDVVAFYQFPDGKVISGTEYGKLLLWEGNLIKCVVNITKEQNCHESGIEVIFRDGDFIVTSGEDGKIKFWDFYQLDNAEADDDNNFFINPEKEFHIETQENVSAHINQILLSENFWILQDANGKIFKYDLKENKYQCILETNSGKLVSMNTSEMNNAIVSVNSDATVKLWDPVNKQEFYKRKFLNNKGTCSAWVPYNPRNKGRMIAVGFQNGIVRFLLLNQSSFQLIHAVKVHKTAIKFLSFNPQGTTLLVVSVDGDIFCVELDVSNLQHILPYCLYESKFKINNISWDSEGTKVLLSCADGKIHEMYVPKQNEVDTTETYLNQVSVRSYTIKMMEFQKPKRDELDLEILLKKKNLDEKEEEWEPAPILNAIYYNDFSSQNEKVLASVDGRYLGYLYIIDLNQDRPIKSIQIAKVPCHIVKFIENDEILVCGYDDGSFQLTHKYDFYSKELRVACHDKDFGKIKNVVVSFDKKFVITASEDCTIFCNKVDWGALERQFKGGEFITNFNFPEMTGGLNENTFAEEIKLEFQVEEDIIDDKIYSVQEAKLFLAEDQKRSLAEKKKQKVRKQVQELIQMYENVKKQNSEIEPNARLDQKQMTIDQEFNDLLQYQINQEIEETKKELKWDAEKAKLKTKKLKDFVLGELAVDRFAVISLRNPQIFVRTFKVKKMSAYVLEKKNNIYYEIEEESRRQQEQEQEKNRNTFKIKADQNTDDQKKDNISPAKQAGQQDQGNAEDKEDEEEQKKIRNKRDKYKLEQEKIRKQILELQKQEPTEKTFDPDHLKEIDELTEKLGDYKLKSAADYVVPELQRMNVGKQQKHMILVEEFIFNTKMKFNNQCIILKKKKSTLMEKIQSYNERILKINNELGIQEQLFNPQIDMENEFPDSFYVVSQEEILKREKEINDEQIKKTKKKPAGMDEDEENEEKKQQEEQQQQAQVQAQDQGQQQAQQQQQQVDQQKTTQKREKLIAAQQYKQRKNMKVQASDLENEAKSINEIILLAEKKRLMNELNEEIDEFDADVLKYQNEKSILESEMKTAEMKLVTMFQELLILDDMEEKDNKLISNLQEHRKKRDELEQQSNTISEKVKEINIEDAKLERERAEYNKSFKEAVFGPDDDAAREKVHAYYTKKFKKSKAKMKQNEEENEENQDEDEDAENLGSDEEEDDDDDDDDDDEDKPDIQIIEQEQKNKDIIMHIIQLEDNLETNKKQRQDYEKQKNNINNKLLELKKDLDICEKDIKEYQRQKLAKVNKLDVSVFLRLHQIQNLTQVKKGDILPEQLISSILFTEDELQRLALRIVQLQQEFKQSQEEHKLLKKEKAKLDRENNFKQMEINKSQKEYEEKHMLKFGDIIDLQLLDALEPTKQVQEMRQNFKAEERDAISKVELAKMRFITTKKKLLDAKRENTKIIKNICTLGEQQMKLNKKLDNTNKQLLKEDNEDKRDDLDREKQNLKELVKFLSKEITDLKTEIGVFKRKGGHIYTMVTSNKKNLGYNEVNKNLF